MKKQNRSLKKLSKKQKLVDTHFVENTHKTNFAKKRSGLMLDGEYYAVQFEDGTYFTRNGLRYNERTTENIESATLYAFDWEIPKDIYLKQYLYGKDLSYMIVKVRVKTTFEVISS